MARLNEDGNSIIFRSSGAVNRHGLDVIGVQLYAIYTAFLLYSICNKGID
jgi:hypothetical protein